MPKAPKSYLNRRRPTLLEALELEGGTYDEGIASLTRKGYFTPPPRPWSVGFIERGLGRADFVVLDKFDGLVVMVPNFETAELIIKAVNNAGNDGGKHVRSS